MALLEVTEKLLLATQENSDLRAQLDVMRQRTERAEAEVWKQIEYARMVERERDEAKAEVERLKNEIHVWEESDAAAPAFTDLIATAERERDEARAELAEIDAALAKHGYGREGWAKRGACIDSSLRCVEATKTADDADIERLKKENDRLRAALGTRGHVECKRCKGTGEHDFGHTYNIVECDCRKDLR